MRVRRNFEHIYRDAHDPWNIGDADSERYELYRRLVLEHARQRGTMLDIGCGLGAFLARFQGEFASLQGVEVSAKAIAGGRQRFPFIDYMRGSADALASALPAAGRFDAIVYSDVIYYLRERGKRRSLRWIADHLASDGVALIAAWAPGGRYLDSSELRCLVERDFAIERSLLLDSDHAVFVCRPRRVLVAVTVDYETWQPLPEGKTIDWDRDVLRPTARLLDIFDAEGAVLTLMAEMGEHRWLREHDPPVAQQMEEQWREAVQRGHDVQMHLHPAWLPELGARRDGHTWFWDPRFARAEDYPGDLTALIGGFKATLESAIRPVDPTYEVSSFRAGAYEAQPFARLYDALAANRITCDSSVLPGDLRPGRHYDYRLAYSTHQPYFASRFDPQLKAPPAERALVELPAFVVAPGLRWTFDNDRWPGFARRLLRARERAHRGRSTEMLRRRRWLRAVLSYGYYRLRRWRSQVNRLLPRTIAHTTTSYMPERLVEHEYFVMVAHTKETLDYGAIAAGLRWLRSERIELRSLSELARLARIELERTVSSDRAAEAVRQVRRERDAVLSSESNVEQSRELQRRIPLDCRRVLDLGCGAGNWSAAIAQRLPTAEVIGVDVGAEFIAAATRTHGAPRVSFAVEDFAELSFADGTFDCVYADNSLEHAYDVARTFSEILRVLSPGGLLVAAIPADALNPSHICDNHTWKTASRDARMRLEHAGFAEIAIDEVDIYRELGAAPYPPSHDTMLYIRAWRPPATGVTPTARSAARK